MLSSSQNDKTSLLDTGSVLPLPINLTCMTSTDDCNPNYEIRNKHQSTSLDFVCSMSRVHLLSNRNLSQLLCTGHFCFPDVLPKFTHRIPNAGTTWLSLCHIISLAGHKLLPIERLQIIRSSSFQIKKW